jgi:O-antigen/teichoic acid export membrane protein
MMSNVGHVGLNVISSLAIIHYLRPGLYGNYVLIIALATTFGMVADFGINQLAVRHVAVDEAAENAVIGTVIAVRIGLAVVAAVIVQAVLLGLGRSGEVRLAALFITTAFVSNAVMAVTIAFHLRLRQHREALIVLLGELLETSAVLVLIANRASLCDLTLATAAGTAIAAGVAVATTRRVGLRPTVELGRIPMIIRPALPLAMAGLAGVVLVKLDCLMLATLRTSHDVGIYGAAYQPVEYWLVAVVALMTVMVPLLSRFSTSDPERMLLLYRRSCEGFLALVLPVGLLMAFLARPAIALVYPGRYDSAAGPLRILGLSSVLMAVCAWQALVLLSVGRQNLTARYNLAALGFGVVIHIALIDAFGIMGAAFGTLTVACGTAVVSTILVKRVTGLGVESRRLMLVVGATAVGAVVVIGLFAAGAGYWASALAGVCAYLGMLLLFGLLSPRALVLRLRERGLTAGAPTLVEVSA